MIDCAAALRESTQWVCDTLASAGASRLVVGVSGGIDAAVGLGLSVAAVGAESVSSIVIRTTENEREYDDGLRICRHFGCTPEVVDLRSSYALLESALPVSSNPLAPGNLRDRIRGGVLYYFANSSKGLVVSNMNRNELLLGYFCKNGSTVSDVLPLACFYKDEIVQLALHLKVPEDLVKKDPTGDYWIGQRDVDVIGVDYEDQNSILREMESCWRGGSLTAAGLRIQDMVRASAHKRAFPPIPKRNSDWL